MQLRPDQLDQHLAKPLTPLYLLHGDEPLLVLEAADAIRIAARAQGYDEREVLIAGAGFRWEQLAQAGGNLSLFGGNLLIDLRIPTGKPGRDGGEALQRHCAQDRQGVLTLITLPQVDWQTRKAAWFTALVSHGVALELNAPPLQQLPDWVAARMSRQKQSAPRNALEFIAAHVEGNLLAAYQEIQKLGLLYPSGEVSLAQIEAAVMNVTRYDVSDLRDALKARDTLRAACTLEGLKGEDAAPLLVLWALASEARSSSSRPALLHAAKIDRMIKGLARGDIWDEFLQLALRLTRSDAPRTNARSFAR